MASFGGVTFYMVLASPNRSRSSEVTEFTIPDSGVTYVDYPGPGAPHSNRELYFETEADYWALDGLVGTVGTLVDWDGTQEVFLKQLTRKERRQYAGAVSADAEFILGIAS